MAYSYESSKRLAEGWQVSLFVRVFLPDREATYSIRVTVLLLRFSPSIIQRSCAVDWVPYMLHSLSL